MCCAQNPFFLLYVLEHKRRPEDDKLVPVDGGPRGKPAVLQRDEAGRFQRVLLRLLRRFILQERVQAREQGRPSGTIYRVVLQYNIQGRPSGTIYRVVLQVQYTVSSFITIYRVVLYYNIQGRPSGTLDRVVLQVHCTLKGSSFRYNIQGRPSLQCTGSSFSYTVLGRPRQSLRTCNSPCICN